MLVLIASYLAVAVTVQENDQHAHASALQKEQDRAMPSSNATAQIVSMNISAETRGTPETDDETVGEQDVNDEMFHILVNILEKWDKDEDDFPHDMAEDSSYRVFQPVRAGKGKPSPWVRKHSHNPHTHAPHRHHVHIPKTISIGCHSKYSGCAACAPCFNFASVMIAFPALMLKKTDKGLSQCRDQCFTRKMLRGCKPCYPKIVPDHDPFRITHQDKQHQLNWWKFAPWTDPGSAPQNGRLPDFCDACQPCMQCWATGNTGLASGSQCQYGCNGGDLYHKPSQCYVCYKEYFCLPGSACCSAARLCRTVLARPGAFPLGGFERVCDYYNGGNGKFFHHYASHFNGVPYGNNLDGPVYMQCWDTSGNDETFPKYALGHTYSPYTGPGPSAAAIGVNVAIQAFNFLLG